MFGGVFIGVVLDLPCFSRSHRAKIGWSILFVLTFVIWGGGYAFQRWSNDIHKVGWLDFSAGNICESITFAALVLVADDYQVTGPAFLYFFYGFYDACFQSICYWTMGTLSNSPLTLWVYFVCIQVRTIQASTVLVMSVCTKPSSPQVAPWHGDWWDSTLSFWLDSTHLVLERSENTGHDPICHELGYFDRCFAGCVAHFPRYYWYNGSRGVGRRTWRGRIWGGASSSSQGIIWHTLLIIAIVLYESCTAVVHGQVAFDPELPLARETLRIT